MRGEKMQSFLTEKPLPALMFSRNTKHQYYSNVFVTSVIPDRHCLEEANVAPMFIQSEGFNLFGDQISNLSAAAEAIASTVLLDLNSSDCVNAHKSFLGYVYAVLWSETYRTRYSNQLKIDFPRVPKNPGLKLFRELSDLGQKLIALHLLESADQKPSSAKIVGNVDSKITKISYSNESILVNKSMVTENTNLRFISNVSTSVWGFHIGGYQVCEKWLKDRKGMIFDEGTAEQMLQIINIIEATQRLIGEIDSVITASGGWEQL
jgi:predicted helicase